MVLFSIMMTALLPSTSSVFDCFRRVLAYYVFACFSKRRHLQSSGSRGPAALGLREPWGYVSHCHRYQPPPARPVPSGLCCDSLFLCSRFATSLPIALGRLRRKPRRLLRKWLLCWEGRVCQKV